MNKINSINFNQKKNESKELILNEKNESKELILTEKKN